MANFETAYQIVKKWEGGYTDNPNDRGNYNSLGDLVGTNFGISAPTLESWVGFPPSKSMMVNLAPGTAKTIFREKFWNNIKGDQIHSQPLANIFFDGRVNHGRTGTTMMQAVLKVPKDGIVGPQTLNALNIGNERQIYLNYKATRTAFYHLLSKRPGQQVFLNGWLNRINSFNDFTGQGVPAGAKEGIGIGLLMLLGIGVLAFSR